MSGRMKPRTISIDDTLWEQAVRAAAEESARRGKTISVSQYIRDAIIMRVKHAPPEVATPRNPPVD